MLRNNTLQRHPVSAIHFLSIGFLLAICFGTFLLCLPYATRNGLSTSLSDALFTATSAVCVTGLTVLDTGTHWSLFGQIVILFLIQIGALGFVTLSTVAFSLAGRKISLRQRLLLQQDLSGFNLKGLVELSKSVLRITFGLELFVTVIFATQLIPLYGFGQGLWQSFFLAVSAFCNAGIDLSGNFASLQPFSNNPIILYPLMFLIVTGSLGFLVLDDIVQCLFKKKATLSFHAKLVLFMTLILIIIGCFLLAIGEFNNPLTLGKMSLPDKLTNILFASISQRTAGFTTIDLTLLKLPSLIAILFLMFVGGAPGSTAGGLKITTLAVLFVSFFSSLKGLDTATLFHRRLSVDTIRRTHFIFIAAIAASFCSTYLLALTHAANFFVLMFESVAAVGSVGSTLNATTSLTMSGKIIIVLLMYLGRVGPLILGLLLVNKKRKSKLSYAEGKILIG